MNRSAYPFILSSSLMLMACGGGNDDAPPAVSLASQLAGQQQANTQSAQVSSSIAGTAEVQAEVVPESPALSLESTLTTVPAPVVAPAVITPSVSAAPIAAMTPIATPTPIAAMTPIATTTPIATPPPLVTIAPPSTSTLLSAEQTCNQPDFQRTITNLINQARASSQVCGTTSYPAAAPLQWNAKLFNAAAGHSADMAINNYFSHTSLDGRTVGQRISNAGYSWSTYGENIAMGQSSINSVMESWMKSAGHCANIMNSRVTEVAVACVKNSSSRNYWTMVLARPR